jgi:hypothetical protein
MGKPNYLRAREQRLKSGLIDAVTLAKANAIAAFILSETLG